MPASIDVLSTSSAFREHEVKDKKVAVIDVLRTSSTIVTALHNKAGGVIPVSDMGEAGKIAANLDASRYLLCGEFRGHQIQGYHLGNSPVQFTEQKVAGKILILNTTNGTGAISKCHQARGVIIASFLNMDAVIQELKKSSREILLICAGTINNRLALEDMLCAGAITHGVFEGELPSSASDGAKVAFGLYEKFGSDIENAVRHSNYGEWLISNFGSEDVTYCSTVNSHHLLPVWNRGIITATDGS